MKILRKLSMGLLIVLFFVGYGCSGGGDSENEEDLHGAGSTPDVVKNIGPAGGSIQHTSGLSVTVPEGALDSDQELSLTKISIPSHFPDNIAASEAYATGPDGLVFKMPATITCSLPTDASQQAGSPGIYRYDGKNWTYVGGNIEGDTISAEIRGFSTFVTGTSPRLNKKVKFSNNTSTSVVVRVQDVELNNPDISAIPDVSVAVFSGTFNSTGMILPQGKYTFCVDWWDKIKKVNKFYIIGILNADPAVPDDPAVWLAEDTSDVVPPSIMVGEDIMYDGVGTCPGPVGTVGGGDDDTDNGDNGGSGSNYNYKRCRFEVGFYGYCQADHPNLDCTGPITWGYTWKWIDGSYSNNIFNGIDQEKTNYEETLSVEFNESHDIITEVMWTAVEAPIYDGQTAIGRNVYREVKGINLPIIDMSINERTFSVSGVETCDNITSLVLDIFYITSSLNVDLTSYECNEDSYITVTCSTL